MFVYAIGIWNEAKYVTRLLGSQIEYTQDQFEAMIHETIEMVVQHRLSMGQATHSLSDIWDQMVLFLTEDRDFVTIKAPATWQAYGSASIFTDDYNPAVDKELIAVRKYLNTAGYSTTCDSAYTKYFLPKDKKGEANEV
jgi:hypothetical protein